MGLDPFSGVFTAQQIVGMAERRANNPGLYLQASDGLEGIAAPAYLELQSILDTLALTETFTFTRTALDIPITGRINELPTVNNGSATGYWRIGFSDPCWIVPNDNSNGRTRFHLLDAEQFHTRFEDGATGTPQIGYINRSNGTLIVDPAPNQSFTLELHFYPWQIPLSAISDRPWFPYTEYLVEALLCKLYLAQDDQRFQAAMLNRDGLMRKIKRSLGDDRDRASAILQLDPTFYRTPIQF